MNNTAKHGEAIGKKSTSSFYPHLLWVFLKVVSLLSMTFFEVIRTG